MNKIEKAVQELKSEIISLLYESKNSNLSIQTESAENLIQKGWVVNKVKKMVEKNSFQEKDVSRYFDDYCGELPPTKFDNESLELVGNTAHQLIQNVKFQICLMQIRLEISEYLKEVKTQTIN